MPDRQGARFVVEVLFLVGLAGGLAVAAIKPLYIGGVMLAGWLLVALIEWAAWHDEPHYGAGLPPRYYIPRVSLPPAQPLEQVVVGYPEQREEAPTWIASAELRAEMIGDWPAPRRDEVDDARLDDIDADDVDLEDVEPVRLPEPLYEVPPVPDPDPEPEPEPQPEPEAEPPAPEAQPPAPEAEPPAPEAEPPAPQAEPPALVPAAVSLPEPQPEPADGAAETEAEPAAVAVYHLEPFAGPPPRRLFRRRSGGEPGTIEVPARPRARPSVPGRAGGGT
jgi:hypothetical protein